MPQTRSYCDWNASAPVLPAAAEAMARALALGNPSSIHAEGRAARALLENLLRRGGGRDVRLLADLSLAQLRTGDAAAAVATAQRAHALQPASGVAAQALGMALAFAGQDAPRAAALLDKAQVLNGANPLLAEARGKLKG